MRRSTPAPGYLMGRYTVTRRLIIAVTLAAAILSAAPVHTESLPPRLQFVRLLTEQGVSVSSVEAIFQDSQGYMWFGGLDGLVQYDGYNYVSYRNKPDDNKSLSNNVVWDIYEDRQGALWIATDGGLNRFEREQGNFTRFQHDDKNPTSICNNFIRDIAEDRQGNLWIATYSGLARLDLPRAGFTCFAHDPDNRNSIASDQLRTVLIDHADRIWVGSELHGLNRMDLATGAIHRYPFNPLSPVQGTSSRTIVSLLEDRDGYLWIGTDGGGLNRLDQATGEFLHFRHLPGSSQGLSHDTVMDIAADRNGNLWLATERGLNLLDRETFEFNRYVHNPLQRTSLISSVVRSVYVDNNNDLWVGNFPGGVNFLDSSNTAFWTWSHDPADPNSLSHASVLAIEEDKHGNLWLGTDGGGLNYFNRTTGKFTHYLPDPKDPHSISASAVLSIEHDQDGSLWLGTWHGGANHFDPGTGKAKIYRTDPDNPRSISSGDVWVVYKDQQHHLWFATIGSGLNRLDRHTGEFIRYPREERGDPPVGVFWTVYQDHLGQLWTGTGEGLGRYQPDKDRFVFDRHDPNNPDSLSFNWILDIAEDSKKRLWIATRGGGLNLLDRATGKFSRIGEKDGLPSDVITSMEADDQGNFWLGSSSGLTKFNPDTREFIHYTEKNGLQGNQFNIGTAIKTRAGEMVVGGTEGFTIFDPTELTANQLVPPVAIVDFQIFNKPVEVGAKGSPLTKVIAQTDSITLDYHQSVFSFSFVAMSYRSSEKNKFAYMLEGFEKDWNYVNSDRRNATYTNLNSGTYIFKVKAANNHGLWNQKGRSITLHILPPPWKTWWAYTLYGVIVIGIVLLFVRVQHKKVLNERKISRELETKVQERTAELLYKHEELEAAYVQLEAISLSDPLTGLSNRRYLQKLITMDIAKVQRDYDNKFHTKPPQKPSLDLTFFILDVDFFKSVNDLYGHNAGDQLLIQLSELLTKVCRESDCLVRWGGEEFLIVSRFTSRDEAPLMAERIRKSVEKNKFTLSDGTTLHKTCSIGFACYPFLCENPMALSWEQVIDTADRALYAAKRSGRNRSVGLAATNSTYPDMLYQRISLDITGLIDANELAAITQPGDGLVWD